jgi:hypothetical protein
VPAPADASEAVRDENHLWALAFSTLGQLVGKQQPLTDDQKNALADLQGKVDAQGHKRLEVIDQIELTNPDATKEPLQMTVVQADGKYYIVPNEPDGTPGDMYEVPNPQEFHDEFVPLLAKLTAEGQTEAGATGAPPPPPK